MNEQTRRTIADRDPDTWETKPTLNDYAVFKIWVIKTYTEQAWRNYIRFRIGGSY